jgi:hypothetical protein
MKDEDLRDLFAGLAMQGILHIASFGYNSASVARASYELADAMIEAKYDEEPEEPEEPQAGITAIKRKRKATKEM